MSAFRQQNMLLGAIIIGVASSGLTAWLMSSQKTSKTTETVVSYAENPYPVRPAQAPLEDSAMVEQFILMQAQIDALNKRFAELANDMTANQLNSEMLPDNDAGETGPPITDQDQAEQELRQQAEQIANRFQMEQTDVAWADNIAVNIQDAFLAEDILGNSSLNNVDCRTSMCKLDVTFKDGSDLINVRTKLVEKVGEMLPYGAIQPGVSDNEVTIYLGTKLEAFSP